MKRSKKLLLFVYASVALFVVAAFVDRRIADYVEGVSIALRDWSKNSPTAMHAYLACFLLSIVGNTTIFIPFPYAAIVFIMTSQVGLDPLLLGIVSGFGAAAGELASYALGFGGGKYLEKRGYAEKFGSLHAFLLEHRRLLPLAIYVFAATPLPDDALMIPLGMLRYGLVASIVPCFLGKTTMLLFIGYFGSFVSGIGVDLDPVAGILFDAATVCFVASMVYLVAECDWAKLLKPVGKAR
ncbi:MAG: hypothetical protein JTT11_01155 [Candidatus Brockarchaeota archaeon]|nr:hypothetical protein [Candidatus Brockarchaeota archaeon]